MEELSVGILAYNEEAAIGRTIRSVLSQSVFVNGQESNLASELIVIPNGCKDGTAQSAEEAIAARAAPGVYGIRAMVSEIEEAGKERAWNHFVHTVSSKNATYLVLMDADVQLEHPRVLLNLVDALRTNQHAMIAAGIPVKHVELKDRKSVRDRLSIGATSLRSGMGGVLAGCLYCGRAEALRRFRLPTALMGEDAFIRAMTVTNCFTQQDDSSLIVRAEGARVLFESYTSPSEILRNKTRRMLELTINSMLFERFWKMATIDRHAGHLTHAWHDANPLWSEEFVRSEFEARGKDPIPRRFITSQFRQLRFHSWKRRLQLLPVAVATLPLNAVAFHRARATVRSGNLRGLWDKPKESRVGATGL